MAVFYYQNTGTATAPNFAAPVRNTFGFPSNGDITSVKFADIDNDGDLDAFLIDYPDNGGLLYYPNTGTSTNPTFGTMQMNPFGIQTGLDAVSLDLGDVDNDGDTDLVVTEYGYGNMEYYENTGTCFSPCIFIWSPKRDRS